MDIYTKMAYLKGMLEGMDFEDKKEKKLFAAMIDILDELVEAVDDLYEEQDELQEYVESIDADLEDAEELLQDISALPSHKHYGDFPMGSYGEIILYITYAGGEAEVVGMVNSASVRLDGVWWIKGYYFDSQQWCTVLTKYVDKELVPELEEYLK